jgi:DNA polymerase-3 subunit beta
MSEERCPHTADAFDMTAKPPAESRATFPAAALRQALDRAMKVCGKSKVPMLEHVLIAARGGRLSVAATDLDRQLTMHIECEGELAPMAVRPEKLRTVLGACKAEAEIALEAGRLEVRAGAAKGKLATLPGEDFPLFPPIEGAEDVEVECGALKEVLNGVRTAIGRDETRYYLTGAYFDPEEAVVVGTDGHQLAAVPFEPAKSLTASIVPLPAIADLLLFPDGPVRILASERAWRVSSETESLTFKLIDGTYPSWRRVIPAGDRKFAFIAERPLLLAATDQAMKMADQKHRAVTLESREDALVIAAETREEGSVDQVEIEVAAEGECPAFRVNGTYLTNFLKFGRSQKVRIEHDGPNSILCDMDEGRTYLVMALKA